jgi:hypothetical protein
MLPKHREWLRLLEISTLKLEHFKLKPSAGTILGTTAAAYPYWTGQHISWICVACLVGKCITGILDRLSDIHAPTEHLAQLSDAEGPNSAGIEEIENIGLEEKKAPVLVDT